MKKGTEEFSVLSAHFRPCDDADPSRASARSLPLMRALQPSAKQCRRRAASRARSTVSALGDVDHFGNIPYWLACEHQESVWLDRVGATSRVFARNGLAQSTDWNTEKCHRAHVGHGSPIRQQLKFLAHEKQALDPILQ